MSHIEEKEDSRHQIVEAAEFLRSVISEAPDVAVILGSGLGGLADTVQGAIIVPFNDIPHFPASTVAGHSGRLVFGTLGSRKVVVLQGRLHAYEGHAISRVVFPIEVTATPGATCLFVTNASGGIRPGFEAGTLMWITDHINWTGKPGIVPIRSNSQRADDWPDERSRRSTSYYDVEWTDRAEKRAKDLGIATQRGTYLWTSGPSYETKAEIRAFRELGADAVGMSTVPEVLAANMAGMSVIGLSTITNLAAGLGSGHLNHTEVMETGHSVSLVLEKLTLAVLETAPILE